MKPITITVMPISKQTAAMKKTLTIAALSVLFATHATAAPPNLNGVWQVITPISALTTIEATHRRSHRRHKAFTTSITSAFKMAIIRSTLPFNANRWGNYALSHVWIVLPQWQHYADIADIVLPATFHVAQLL